MQQTQDLVSIVMPSYNAARYINTTINSVLAQSYPHWELIVLDDFSKDDTRAIVQKFADSDSRVRLVALEKNHGAPAGPRNLGVRAAKGTWVAFLDADDIWHPLKLEIQLRLMHKYKAPFSSTLSRNFKDESTITYDVVDVEPDVANITFAMQRLKGRIANSSVVANRELLLKYPFNEDMRYKAVEDYHNWLRIHKEIGHSIKIQANFLYYRIIDGQISGSKLYMLKAIFNVHSEFEGSSLPKALLFTASHAIGGFIIKFIKGGF